jgi:hypothetical protein
MTQEQECQWGDCDHPGVLSVLLGEDPVEAERRGSYCVPHAAIVAGDLRDKERRAVWLDLARNPCPAEALPFLRLTAFP